MKGIAAIIERYDRPFEYLGVLLKLIIVFQFWSLWYAPQPEDVARITNLATLMAFEFIMVHSGIFMALFPKKISLYVFVPFYGLFALAFTAIMDDYTVLVIYLFVIFNRMRFAFSDVPTWMRDRAIITSIMAMIFYFVLIIASSSIPLPKLELNETYLEAVQFSSFSDTEGTFIDEPHTAMAFGIFYYLALALFEVYLIKKFRHHYKKISTLVKR